MSGCAAFRTAATACRSRICFAPVSVDPPGKSSACASVLVARDPAFENTLPTVWLGEYPTQAERWVFQ